MGFCNHCTFCVCLSTSTFEKLIDFHKTWNEHYATYGTPKCRNFSFPYLLTPQCRVLLEKLTGFQLVKRFPAFYGTLSFITRLKFPHLSLSGASSIQSMPSHPASWRSVLILSPHLSRGLPRGLFPSGFPTKTLSSPSYVLHAPPTSFFTIWSPQSVIIMCAQAWEGG